MLPVYGLACLLISKLFSRLLGRMPNRYRMRSIMKYSVFVLLVIVLKSVSVSYICREHDAIESEKVDILERRNKRHYLLANVALVGEAIMLAMRTNVK
jgi:hypothetical protein